ncbi:MAG: urease accessory protein UreD [Pseudomonadota bacterium]
MLDTAVQCDAVGGEVARLQRTWGSAGCRFEYRAGRTRLADLHQSGALKVRFPKTAGLAAAEAVILNTAGGLTDGDRLTFEASVDDGASASLTTQACERIYASRGENAHIESRLSVGKGASAAWLPQETILFDAARLRRRLEVDMATNSTLLAVESILFGRDAMGERLNGGAISDRWMVRRGGRLIHAEALRIDEGRFGDLGRPALLADGKAISTILYVAPDASQVAESLRGLVQSLADPKSELGLSAWNEKLLLRIVAADGFHLRRRLVPLLTALNRGLTLPRVWSL